jgi:hypothetical protein
VIDRCKREEPELAEVAPNQVARCWVLMRNVAEEAAEVAKEIAISQDAAKKLQEIPGAGG